MRTRTRWLALLLTAGMALVPSALWGQLPGGELLVPDSTAWPLPRPSSVRAQDIPNGGDVGLADPVFPFPLYSPRPEMGGFFLAGEFVYWRQTNPLSSQTIAIRGFQDTDGSVSGVVGFFFGSGDEALNSRLVGGPGTYIPGYRLDLGYRFRSGLVTELIYTHLFNVRYTAAAATLPRPFPPPGGLDPLLANTFLFAPVFNFPLGFVGPAFEGIAGQAPNAMFGIWNAADEMVLRFEQHLDKWELRFRVPIYETDYDPVSNPDPKWLAYRLYGLCGLRHYWLWERFKWTATDRNNLGEAGPEDTAIYSNLLSQPMYGPFIGIGLDKWLGTPGLAITVDLTTGLYLNFVREIVRWERDDRAYAAKRSRRVYTVAPDLEAQINLWWYPIEGIQIRLGYDFMGVFNTIASPEPVDFNFGGLAPDFRRHAVRYIDGWNVGIGFIF